VFLRKVKENIICLLTALCCDRLVFYFAEYKDAGIDKKKIYLNPGLPTENFAMPVVFILCLVLQS
jgi:hypothetical protein